MRSRTKIIRKLKSGQKKTDAHTAEPAAGSRQQAAYTSMYRKNESVKLQHFFGVLCSFGMAVRQTDKKIHTGEEREQKKIYIYIIKPTLQ